MLGLPFAAVVNSLVENLVLAIVAMIFGEPSFRGLTFTINDAVFGYGAFITDAIQFVAIAAAVMARRTHAPEEEGMPDEERRHQELLDALRASR